MTSQADLQALASRFVDFARHVMTERERRNVISGVDREWSRFNVHLASAEFAEKPVSNV